MNRAALRDALVSSFNIPELINLCVDIGVNFESLRGDTIDQKASELVEYCLRRGIEAKLIYRCQELRPHVPWAVNIGQNPSNTVAFTAESDPNLHHKSESEEHIFSTLRLDEDELWFLLIAMRFIEGGPIGSSEEIDRKRMEYKVMNHLLKDFGYELSDLLE